MAPRRSRPPPVHARGASLLELLAAGAVLLAGLVAILQFLLLSTSHLRNADAAEAAQVQVDALLAPYERQPFAALEAGVLTLPDTVDELGRTFRRSVRIDSVSDGGLGLKRVTASVSWCERTAGLTTARTNVGQALVPEGAVDAAP